MVQVDWVEANGSEDTEYWQAQPFAVPRFMTAGGVDEKLVAYRVSDDLMIGRNIKKDDVAILEQRKNVRDG